MSYLSSYIVLMCSDCQKCEILTDTDIWERPPRIEPWWP